MIQLHIFVLMVCCIGQPVNCRIFSFLILSHYFFLSQSLSISSHSSFQVAPSLVSLVNSLLQPFFSINQLLQDSNSKSFERTNSRDFVEVGAARQILGQLRHPEPGQKQIMVTAPIES